MREGSLRSRRSIRNRKYRNAAFVSRGRSRAEKILATMKEWEATLASAESGAKAVERMKLLYELHLPLKRLTWREGLLEAAGRSAGWWRRCVRSRRRRGPAVHIAIAVASSAARLTIEESAVACSIAAASVRLRELSTLDDRCNTEPLGPGGVVKLIVGKRDDDFGNARTHSGSERADARVVDRDTTASMTRYEA